METGLAENKFWDLVELDHKDSEDGCTFDAKCITSAYGKSFSRLAETTAYADHEWYSFLISIGLDGASVNMGKWGGVQALLKKLVPSLIAIHSVAHRLELSAGDDIKEILF